MYNCLRQLVFESAVCEPEETLWAKLPSYYVGEAFVRLIPKGMLQIYLNQDIPTKALKKIFAESLAD